MKGVTSTSPIRTTVPASETGGDSFTYDPEFRGPVKQRSCTDVICLFLFLSFLAGWAVIAIFAFKHGDPSVLLNPTDSHGNICGMYHMESKPYLFFFDLTKCASPSVIFKGCPTPQVCVEQCPNETFYVSTATGEGVKEKLICTYNANRSKSVGELIKTNQCASLYLKSKPLVGRCIPDIYLKSDDGQLILDKDNKTIKTDDGKSLTVETITKASRFLAQFLSTKEVGEKIFSDLKSSWKIILIGLLLIMVLCFIWIMLMRWVAGIMVWLSILAVTGFAAYACYFSVTRYLHIRNQAGSDAQFQFTTNFRSILALKNTWLAFAIISSIIFLIMFILLLFLRKRILIAIALIKEASKAVGCMISALFFPFLPYLLQLAIAAFWAAVALYIASSGKATFVVYDAQPGSTVQNGTECKPWAFNVTNAHCLFKSYGQTHLLEGQIYNLFAMLWGVFFIIGVGEVSLAGAFAAYYWALRKPKDVPCCAIGIGFWRCIRYHMGSVAFGSLLIATVRLIRIMLEYIDQKCKKYDNQVTRAIMCCLKCCFWCLEKFLKFINKNAYIMVAVYGTNFCTSAKNAFNLLLRNIVRVVVLDKVTDFLLLIGKMAVVGAAAAGSFVLFHNKVKYVDEYVPTLNYSLLPVIVITIGAYIIASVFFNVYGMAVDTLFLCFLEDIERNDGSPERPYYMSKELMKILDKKNKFREPKG